MPRRPLIGLAMQTLEPIPGKVPLCWVMGQRYVHALTAAGALPFLVPLLPEDEPTVRDLYERLDGVFLTGGIDIDPTLYGETTRHPTCDEPDPARDWTELRLIRWAIADDKPVLGVCRGIQAINVACGGSLYQDVASQQPGSIKHDYFPNPLPYPRDHLAHTVHIRPDTLLGRILGTSHLEVNSMHHQGLRELAPRFEATAFAPDGLIEGIERPDAGFVVGVQWHPEELVGAHEPMRRLFHAFVQAARERA